METEPAQTKKKKDIFTLFLYVIAATIAVSLLYGPIMELLTGGVTDDAYARICIEKAPIFNFTCSKVAFVNTTYTCNVTAYDPNNSIIYFDNTTLFNISNLTGLINFTPTDAHIGNHSILITAQDNSTCKANKTYTLNLTVMMPLLMNITLDAYLIECNSTFVTLNWTDIYADTYDLYYANNITYLWNLDPYTTIANIIGLTTTQYNDTTAFTSHFRYYRIVGIKSGAKTMSNIAGKISVDAIKGSAVTVSNPFNQSNISLNKLICPKQNYCGSTTCADSIRVFYGNNQQKYAYWFGSTLKWFSPSVPKLLEIEPNYGYFIKPINNSYNITWVGKVPTYGANITYNFTGSSAATIGVNYPRFYNFSPSFTPAQSNCGSTTCADSGRVFYGFNQQKYAYWFGPINRWFSPSVPKLLYIEPGYGYFFKPVNNSYIQQFDIPNSGFFV
jgi:hypothetical protein